MRRSKSVLFSSDTLKFPIKESNNSSRLTLMKSIQMIPITEPIAESVESFSIESDSKNSNPSHSPAKKESLTLKGMEEVYIFNKSLKSNNALVIEKLEKLNFPPSSSNILSQQSLLSYSNLSPTSKADSKIFYGTKTSPIRRESIKDIYLSKISIKYNNRRDTAKIFSEETFVDTLKRILGKKYNDRSDEDIKVLVKILNKVAFFETLGVDKENNLLEQCCRYINLEYGSKGEHVFHFGSLGKKFYIILQGSVGVLIPRFGQLKNSEFQEVKVLKDGESFGELALISSKTRSASIVCKENCYFLVLDKKYFLEILLGFEQRKLADSLDFLKKYSIFDDWSSPQLTSVFLSMNELKFTINNNLVFKQGDFSNDLYFVKSGEFEYKKEVKYFDSEQHKNFDELPNIYKNTYALRNSRKFEIPIARFGIGSLIGDESVFLNKEKAHSLYCASDEGVLMTLNKTELFHRWNADNFKEMISKIHQQCLKKEAKYQSRFNEYLNCVFSDRKPDNTNKLNVTTTKINQTIYKEDGYKLSDAHNNSKHSKFSKSINLPKSLKLKLPKIPPFYSTKSNKSVSFNFKFNILKNNNFNINTCSDTKRSLEETSKLLEDIKTSQMTEVELEEYNHKNDIKTAVEKLHHYKNVKGLSKKRSKTLILQKIDEFENVIDSHHSMKNNAKLNYSLSKRKGNQSEEFKLSDPNCLISILNPKFRMELKVTEDRYKLMKKKN